MQNLALTVGPTHLSDGGQGAQGLRAGREAELIMSELHGKYYEKNSRGGMFGSAWNAVTVAATHVSPLAAGTGTPIWALYNPIGSNVNCAILKVLQDLTSGTPGGPLLWNLIPVPQNISAANTLPVSLLLNSPVSSVAKIWTNTALTGSSAGTLLWPEGGFAAVAAGAGIQSLMNLHDGDIIVPPGSMIALCAYATGTTHLTSGMVVHEEVAVL